MSNEVRPIDANAMMSKICKKNCNREYAGCGYAGGEWASCEYYDFIAEQPTIEAEPVRHGKWLNKNDIFECSECHYSFDHEGYKHFFNFCPCCGAKMDGDTT